MISIATDRRNSRKKETTPKSGIVASARQPASSDSSAAPCSDDTPSVDRDCQEDGAQDALRNARVSAQMDRSVPDVVVLAEEKGTCRSDDVEPYRGAGSGDNNLQVMVDPELTPRNKSPVTVQEWVDSLPLNPNETSR